MKPLKVEVAQPSRVNENMLAINFCVNVVNIIFDPKNCALDQLMI